ncbi:hypothetical protein [Actinomadura sp. 9N407]|uniref:hypothetical protein n=1 Tax=Actinomadura sp. 9N407 TaxID=3375154 RepID=UPI0037918CD4
MTLGFGVGTGPPAVTGRRRRRRPSGKAVLYRAALPAAAGLLLGMAISLGWAVQALATTGRFLDFYCGVFALVALTLSIMIGLLAADRTVMSSRARVRAQAMHRAAAFTAVTMLVLHLGTQLLRHRVGLTDAFLPIHTGSLAFYLLIVAVASGIARGRFAPARRPWLWRALHLTAYAAWPLAIGHGLTVGRTPPGYVRMAYLASLVAVALALAVRLVLQIRRRRAP